MTFGLIAKSLHACAVTSGKRSCSAIAVSTTGSSCSIGEADCPEDSFAPSCPANSGWKTSGVADYLWLPPTWLGFLKATKDEFQTLSLLLFGRMLSPETVQRQSDVKAGPALVPLMRATVSPVRQSVALQAFIHYSWFILRLSGRRTQSLCFVFCFFHFCAIAWKILRVAVALQAERILITHSSVLSCEGSPANMHVIM